MFGRKGFLGIYEKIENKNLRLFIGGEAMSEIDGVIVERYTVLHDEEAVDEILVLAGDNGDTYLVPVSEIKAIRIKK